MNEEEQSVERSTTTKAVGDSVVERETVQQTSKVSGRVVVSRLVWFIVGAISVILAIRVILMMLAANQGNAFVDFIYALGGIFAAPFFGIFGYTPTYGNSAFEISSIVAILVYLLLGWGIVKLLNIAAPAGEAE